MRTLAILAAILLVALLAQAEPLQARTDESTAAQEQIPADNPEVVISFAWDESLAPKDSGERDQHAELLSLEGRTGDRLQSWVSAVYVTEVTSLSISGP
ncbi:neutrophil defensin 8-like [Trachypithecus francoisi]|uniref:neutrophil defensin 8-like n=1 Tax=Trachypithecus francoisi TaxID=54180 RepID=UPI00141AF956|nr:neutrophil defensin 8-like [Trachypithecus francoisi]